MIESPKPLVFIVVTLSIEVCLNSICRIRFDEELYKKSFFKALGFKMRLYAVIQNS